MADALHLTRPGVTLGTVTYMSPEQARGEPLDARSDIFSLGAVLFEMATGQPAFARGSLAATFEAILSGAPPSPQSLNPGVPSRLAEIIAKALEKDTSLRYQHAGDMLADLKRLKRDSAPTGASAATPGGVARVPASSRRHWSVLSAIVAGCVLTIAGGLALRTWLGRQKPTPFRNFSMVQVTYSGHAKAAAVSPDGKLMAEARVEHNEQGLWLRFDREQQRRPDSAARANQLWLLGLLARRELLISRHGDGDLCHQPVPHAGAGRNPAEDCGKHRQLCQRGPGWTAHRLPQGRLPPRRLLVRARRGR